MGKRYSKRSVSECVDRVQSECEEEGAEVCWKGGVMRKATERRTGGRR